MISIDVPPMPPTPYLGNRSGKESSSSRGDDREGGPGTAVGSQPNTPFGVGLTTAESSVTLGYLLNFSGAQFLWKENHIEPTIQRGFLKSVNKRALSTWSFVKSLWVSLDRGSQITRFMMQNCRKSRLTYQDL